MNGRTGLEKQDLGGEPTASITLCTLPLNPDDQIFTENYGTYTSYNSYRALAFI